MQNKITLIYTNRIKPVVAPLGLEYLASILSKNGFQPEVLDLCFEEDWQGAIKRYFAQNEVFAVGLNLRNIDQLSLATREFFLPEFKEIVSLIKTQTSAPLILGGTGFSLMPEAILDYVDVDLGIWGEGEYSLPLLLKKFQKGEESRDIPGLVYCSNGRFIRNPSRYIELSKLPTPKRGFIENIRYFKEGGVAGIECRRSCNRQCIYCPDPWIKGRKIRYRSPDSVVREMEVLLQQGMDHIYFCDSEFNVPDETYARELCLKIIKKGLGSKVRWNADLLPVPFSKELAELFLRSGCGGVAFNIDTCSEKMLRNMGRDFGVEEIYNAAEICHFAGLNFIFYLLLGGPGETKETLKETAENLKRIPHHGLVTVFGIRILPGTKIAEMVKKEGSLDQNPNLQGEVRGNENFLSPIFYLSSVLGPEEEVREYITDLFEKDKRLFFAKKGKAGTFINNEDLIKAIKAGHRGVFWDVLRKLARR